MTPTEFERAAARLRLKYSAARLEEINAMPKARRDRERAIFWRKIEAAYTLLREPPGRFFMTNPFEEPESCDTAR